MFNASVWIAFKQRFFLLWSEIRYTHVSLKWWKKIHKIIPIKTKLIWCVNDVNVSWLFLKLPPIYYPLKFNSTPEVSTRVSIYEYNVVRYANKIFLIFCLDISNVLCAYVRLSDTDQIHSVYFSILHFIGFTIWFNGHLSCNLTFGSVTSQWKVGKHTKLLLKEFQTEQI